jgi:hypothetical protein
MAEAPYSFALTYRCAQRASGGARMPVRIGAYCAVLALALLRMPAMLAHGMVLVVFRMADWARNGGCRRAGGAIMLEHMPKAGCGASNATFAAIQPGLRAAAMMMLALGGDVKNKMGRSLF